MSFHWRFVTYEVLSLIKDATLRPKYDIPPGSCVGHLEIRSPMHSMTLELIDH